MFLDRAGQNIRNTKTTFRLFKSISFYLFFDKCIAFVLWEGGYLVFTILVTFNFASFRSSGRYQFFRTLLLNSLKLVLSKPFVKLISFQQNLEQQKTWEYREKRGLEYRRSSLSKKGEGTFKKSESTWGMNHFDV